MGKTLRIVFFIFLAIVGIEAVILALLNTFSFRFCRDAKYINLDSKIVKCGGKLAFSSNTASFILPVEKITFESDEAFIIYKFPIVGNLSMPLKMQAGLSGKVTLCPVSVTAGGIKYTCQEKSASEFTNVLKPGDIVMSAVVDPNFLSPGDNFRVRCGQTQGDFLSRVKKGDSILPYLLAFRKGTCTPSIRSVLYRSL